MHIHTQTMTEHAPRFADTRSSINRITDRKRMQDGTPVAYRMPARCRKHPTNIGFGDCAASEIDIGNEAITTKASARHRRDNGFELHPRHALGDIDCLTDHL